MTIDGKDLYTEWGCKLLEGSFDDLLKYPKRKAVKYNKTRSHTDGFQRNNAKCLDEKGISRFVPHSSF